MQPALDVSASPARSPSQPSSATTATLHRLLDAHLNLAAEYSDQLTSHLPMALHALASLGADSERLQAFYTLYGRRLSGGVVVASGEPVDDWRVFRGNPDAFPVLLATMNRLVAREGIDATLRSTLPELLPGVAAAAMHGLIRTAHAVESGHPAEVAAALAYWAWRFQPLAPPRESSGSPPFSAWADALWHEPPGGHFSGSLIATRMDQATHEPSGTYQRFAGSLAPFPTLPSAIAAFTEFAIRLYLATKNFTVLHLVTGLRALRVLSPWLPADSAANTQVQTLLVHAFTAAYASASLRPAASAPGPSSPPRTWPDVLAAAIVSDDDHTIKIVHACRDEATAYGEGLYLEAAAFAVG